MSAPATIDVFYYTGPYTVTLLPASDALIERLSPTRRDRLKRHASNAQIIELVALRILELGMDVRGHASFRLADVEYAHVEGVTKKPYWTQGDVSFSISHTRSMAMVAIAHKGAVGVDVELRRAVDPRIVRRLLNDEAAARSQLDEGNALVRWTQIESVLKGAGIGIMHGKEIEWRADEISLRERRWYLHEVRCGEQHVAHVATDVHNAKINVVAIELL